MVILVGCQNSNNLSLRSHDISEITISNFSSFGQINDHTILTIRNKQEINQTVELIENAKKIQGVMDVAEMHYDINIIYNDQSKKGFHIYLGEEDGTMLDVENTGQGYSLTGKSFC
jgi:hypothetical protein